MWPENGAKKRQVTGERHTRYTVQHELDGNRGHMSGTAHLCSCLPQASRSLQILSAVSPGLADKTGTLSRRSRPPVHETAESPIARLLPGLLRGIARAHPKGQTIITASEDVKQVSQKGADQRSQTKGGAQSQDVTAGSMMSSHSVRNIPRRAVLCKPLSCELVACSDNCKIHMAPHGRAYSPSIMQGQFKFSISSFAFPWSNQFGLHTKQVSFP